jgi:hypothetical protein
MLRYSLADGTRPWDLVGDDLDEAIAARDASRHTSKPSTQTSQSFKTRMKPVARKSLTPLINGSPSFRSFKAKTSKAKARRPCRRTTTGLDSFSTSRCSRSCGT